MTNWITKQAAVEEDELVSEKEDQHYPYKQTGENVGTVRVRGTMVDGNIRLEGWVKPIDAEARWMRVVSLTVDTLEMEADHAMALVESSVASLRTMLRSLLRRHLARLAEEACDEQAERMRRGVEALDQRERETRTQKIVDAALAHAVANGTPAIAFAPADLPAEPVDLEGCPF